MVVGEKEEALVVDQPTSSLTTRFADFLTDHYIFVF